MRFLLDEHIEHEVLGRLENDGHDPVHVELTDELCKGADDSSLAAVSLQTERIIVTYDDDFRREFTEDDYYAVLLFGDEELPPDSVAEILDRVATHYTHEEVTGIQTVGRSWL